MDEREHSQHEDEAAAGRQDELVEDLDVPEEDSRQVKGGITVRKAGGDKQLE